MTDSPSGNGTVGPLREPTMADIADQLGISRQLVSLVLRDQPGPSERTRARVLKAAQDLGYQPHHGARVLRQSRRTQIGVGFVPTNFYEPDVVEAIYGIAKTAGYRVVLSAHAPGRGTDRVLAELQSHRCAGVITIGSTLEDWQLAQIVRRMQTPVALVGHGVKNDDYDVIHSRGDRGIERCLQHLVSLGHREIAYVDAPTLRPAPLRLSGYLRACQDAGINPQVFSATKALAEEAGASAARQMLSARELPTAIACVNDQAAFGAAMVLSRAGKRIPEDVSITGFDDSQMARWTFLDLTSARQDPVALGESAVASLLRRIADRGLMRQEVVVDPELVIRSSTSGPRPSD